MVLLLMIFAMISENLFQDLFSQANESLTTTNGTGLCLQEVTVNISLIDDNGTRHAFILDSCLYHPNSPVNLLYMRWLAEKFIVANGNPDNETRIESCYSTHVLTWSFGQFWKKISHTNFWPSLSSIQQGVSRV
jgi:hypothetical protein